MVELTDMTLCESEGNFKLTCQLMEREGTPKWMLRSDVYISLGLMSFAYLLHFWDNGDVYIIQTNHPPLIEVPDDDIRELHEWILENGWKRLVVNKNLIDNKQGFEFWMRKYVTGLVYNEEMERHEQEEMKRFAQAVEQEKLEDDDAD
jgi:uncharacterized protein YchJ